MEVDTASMKPIRILVAEDHETVRQGLRLLLEAERDIEVVAEAANGLDAVEQCKATHPQVVILDISMPDMNGLAAAREIRRVLPHVAIVALTRHDDEAFVHELLAAGASGYVLKQSRSTELLTAIRAVAAGGQYVDRLLAARAAAEAEIGSKPRPVSVSEREKEVLRMMAVGHSNKGIAADLNISIKTVEVHKANAMRKLGLRGRIDVVRFAVLHGWLQEP
jgi:two-component system, NarL family, response regulator NreC